MSVCVCVCVRACVYVSEYVYSNYTNKFVYISLIKMNMSAFICKSEESSYRSYL